MFAPEPYTVVVPLKSPNLLFPYSLATASIVRRGAEDFTRPVGTGPFSFGSLDPRQQAVCRRNPAYWQPGKPYLDELVFLSVKDDFARLNALLSGRTDVMAQVPFTQAKSQLVGDVRLIRSPGVTAQAFLHGSRQAAVRRRPGAPHAPAHRRPQATGRRRTVRVRHGRKRPVRQGT